MSDGAGPLSFKATHRMILMCCREEEPTGATKVQVRR